MLLTLFRFGMLLLLTVGMLACDPRVHEMQGMIVDVVAHDPPKTERVSVLDDKNIIHTFTVDNAVNLAVSSTHLRLHMTDRVPVIVKYRTEGDGQIAVEINDVPEK